MIGPLKLTCREAQVLLSARLDRPLRPAEALRLRLHLTVCDWCARIARHFAFLSQAVRRIGAPPPGP